MGYCKNDFNTLRFFENYYEKQNEKILFYVEVSEVERNVYVFCIIENKNKEVKIKYMKYRKEPMYIKAMKVFEEETGSEDFDWNRIPDILLEKCCYENEYEDVVLFDEMNLNFEDIEKVKDYLLKIDNIDLDLPLPNAQGLDGFHMFAYLPKNDFIFYSWCCFESRNYDLIIELVNILIDKLNISDTYRFRYITYY